MGTPPGQGAVARPAAGAAIRAADAPADRGGRPGGDHAGRPGRRCDADRSGCADLALNDVAGADGVADSVGADADGARSRRCRAAPRAPLRDGDHPRVDPPPGSMCCPTARRPSGDLAGRAFRRRGRLPRRLSRLRRSHPTGRTQGDAGQRPLAPAAQPGRSSGEERHHPQHLLAPTACGAAADGAADSAIDERTRAHHAAVHKLLDQGVGLLECSRRLGWVLNTVKRYARAATAEQLQRPPRCGRTLVVVIATGVRADGWREVLGFAVGDSEDGAFWTAFLRSSEGPRPGRGAAGHLRRPHRAQAGHRRGAARRGLAAVIRQHQSVAGGSRWSTSTAGRGPWQRDLRGPAADPSLPVAAFLDRPVGVVPRAPG